MLSVTLSILESSLERSKIFLLTLRIQLYQKLEQSLQFTDLSFKSTMKSCTTFYRILNNIHPLDIREDKYSGIYVEGLTEYSVSNSRDCFALLKRGEKNRVTRHTKINSNSSRSHSIFQLLVEINTDGTKATIKRSKLNLCDLAGSERNSKEDDINSMHLLELKTINLSLTTLGKVISALSK
jgi:Kinesin motor domain